MPKPKRDRSETYTYKDYLTWDGPERWELIDGTPYMLASPTHEHQLVLGQLHIEIGQYLRDKDCDVYIAPMDLCFEESFDTKHVVQPDMFVMCGKYGRDKRIVGVPVLVIEVLSPSTAAQDLIRKLNLYQRVKVQEYWIVEPDEKIINVYLHDGTTLRWTAEYKPGDKLNPTMFSDLEIDVSVIFA
ncbi:MAG: Uma2 family endonuclease [Alicyclobacillus sp.]|nr:Uma2 family endonuclease [Alicyclobacillus sp.]